MFVELYENKLEYEAGPNGKVVTTDIVSTNTVIETSAFRFINMIPTEVNDKSYYRVRLSEDTEYKKYYILARDYERLIH